MQHKINLNGNTVLFVWLEKATYIAFLDKNELIVRMGYEFHQEQNEIKLPQGDWQLIGIYPELTEEQAKIVVEIHSITRLQSFGYKNYLKSTNYIHDFSCKTAKESFQSLMEREECYTVNPYAKAMKSNIVDSIEEAEFIQDMFNEAEQRTFYKWAILIQR